MPDRKSPNEFGFAIEAYIAMLQSWHDVYYAKHYPNVPKPIFEANTRGKVNVKIIAKDMHGYGGSAHSFVRRETGVILKAAGWTGPAKGDRGSIYSDRNGAEALGPYGSIRYLN